MTKVVLADASDVEILLRMANRAERLIRLSDVGAPATVVETERRLLADVVNEWLRRVSRSDPAQEEEEEG